MNHEMEPPEPTERTSKAVTEFWRDVLTKSLSTVIGGLATASIIYGVGLASGALKLPPNPIVFVIFFAVIGALVVGSYAAWLGGALTPEEHKITLDEAHDNIMLKRRKSREFRRGTCSRR